jgi:hypothetical protein
MSLGEELFLASSDVFRRRAVLISSSKDIRAGFYSSSSKGKIVGLWVHPKSVALMSIPHALPPTTSLYGESFQMLSQTEGTIQDPVSYHRLRHGRCRSITHLCVSPRAGSQRRRAKALLSAAVPSPTLAGWIFFIYYYTPHLRSSSDIAFA